jgi:hypothetical protein
MRPRLRLLPDAASPALAEARELSALAAIYESGAAEGPEDMLAQRRRVLGLERGALEAVVAEALARIAEIGVLEKRYAAAERALRGHRPC